MGVRAVFATSQSLCHVSSSSSRSGCCHLWSHPTSPLPSWPGGREGGGPTPQLCGSKGEPLLAARFVGFAFCRIVWLPRGLVWSRSRLPSRKLIALRGERVLRGLVLVCVSASGTFESWAFPFYFHEVKSITTMWYVWQSKQATGIPGSSYSLQVMWREREILCGCNQLRLPL